MQNSGSDLLVSWAGTKEAGRVNTTSVTSEQSADCVLNLRRGKCGAGGGSRILRPFERCGFSYRLWRSPPGHCTKLLVRFAVWTIPSPSSADARFRCRPSSLTTFPPWIFAGLGSGLPFREVSPTLSLLHRGFPREQSRFSSAASANPRSRAAV
jgi:hypothetical protein